MLHELSHIVHGPHDAKFHALWNQLRDEHEGLALKGYTGEGFLSEGHRLGGGRQIPMSEARRLARVQAEKRRTLNKGSGQRLGGSAPRPGQDIRNVIAGASERRIRALQGCGNTNHNDSEIRRSPRRRRGMDSGHRLREDAANEAAIAQALWELVQGRREGQVWQQLCTTLRGESRRKRRRSILLTVGMITHRNQVFWFNRRQGEEGGSSSQPPVEPEIPGEPSSAPSDAWTCGVCTLVNPATFPAATPVAQRSLRGR